MEEEHFGKKILNNEEIDLETCDLEKLKELRDKMLQRKEKLKNSL